MDYNYENNNVYRKSFDLARDIVLLVREIQKNQKEYEVTKQLVRSGTSIGANISEGIKASSKKDFAHKLSISSKEAMETKYWINLLFHTKMISKEVHKKFILQVDELSKILYSILSKFKYSN